MSNFTCGVRKQEDGFAVMFLVEGLETEDEAEACTQWLREKLSERFGAAFEDVTVQ